ncbi:hypothetical protein FYJ85_17355 [Victivallaceae bacterium BBE-744-WT-12]|uniref:Glycoside hydrolase family 42 N-terminal domain-containing protein n=1 Tax=Victivallis lenta TaxID=2606640 RepID=A0A844G615_9BACT|nr:hypothetical protein [Victivallis lenta]MST98806.1 hypothetical protein [Victivallis lenta]
MNLSKTVLALFLAVFSVVLNSAEFKVDRYGQAVGLEFPDKITSDAELKADVDAHNVYYTSFTIPERTYYGGLPGSKEKYNLTRTGFFHLEKIEELDGRVMLVDPEGNLYFHLGVCSMMPGNEFTTVKGREELYEWLPTADSDFRQARWAKAASFYLANWIRKYGSYDEVKWQKTIVERLRRLGFNGYGEFSQIFPGNDKLGFAYTKCLEHYWKKGFSITAGRSIDPFDPQNAVLLEKEFASRVKSYFNDPGLIGFYTENEVFYHEVMPQMLKRSDTFSAKQEFARKMQEYYKNNIAIFNKEWNISLAGFDRIATTALEAKTPEAKKALAFFEEFYWDTYFRLVSTTLKKVDPDHLYLGERIHTNQLHNDLVNRIMGKYCDVFSANYYTEHYDPEMIQKLANLTGRPIILSEWNYGCREQGLPGVVNVADQKERAKRFRLYAEQSAADRNVIGTQWFCLIDEALTGRGFNDYNGERLNTGLFNICDRPYKELCNAAAESNSRVYDLIEKKVSIDESIVKEKGK